MFIKLGYVSLILFEIPRNILIRMNNKKINKQTKEEDVKINLQVSMMVDKYTKNKVGKYQQSISSFRKIHPFLFHSQG